MYLHCWHYQTLWLGLKDTNEQREGYPTNLIKFNRFEPKLKDIGEL